MRETDWFYFMVSLRNVDGFETTKPPKLFARGRGEHSKFVVKAPNGLRLLGGCDIECKALWRAKSKIKIKQHPGCVEIDVFVVWFHTSNYLLCGGLPAL